MFPSFASLARPLARYMRGKAGSAPISDAYVFTRVDMDVSLGLLPAPCSQVRLAGHEFAALVGISPDELPEVRERLGLPTVGDVPLSAMHAYHSLKRGDTPVAPSVLKAAARREAAEIIRTCAVWHREALPPEELGECIANRLVRTADALTAEAS